MSVAAFPREYLGAFAALWFKKYLPERKSLRLVALASPTKGTIM
jgi:hypothetical protein